MGGEVDAPRIDQIADGFLIRIIHDW